MFLTEQLYRTQILVEKHASLIDKIKFSPEPSGMCTFTRARVDKFNQGSKKEDGSELSQFFMLVDDNLYAETRDNIKKAIVTNIEAIFLILGFSEDHKRVNTISLDKFYESVCSYDRVQLEKRLNTKTMLVSLSLF